MHLLCLSHPRVPLSTEDVRTDRRELAPRPALPDGVGGDSIRAEGALVGKWHSQRNSKRFAPGGLSAERLGCRVACGQLAGPEVPLEGHLPLPPSHPTLSMKVTSRGTSQKYRHRVCLSGMVSFT